MSISAPKMQIRSQLPLPIRFVFWVLVLAVAGAAALWAYDMGRSFAGLGPTANGQVDALDTRVKQLELDRERLISELNAAASEINIERATQKPFQDQIKALELENTKLKEDLSFFESLLPTNTGAKGISIQSLSLELVNPNQVRYRILVTQGGGKRDKREFYGQLQLVVTVLQEGNSAMITFPKDRTADAEKYNFRFKHYQRLEGTLTLPAGAIIKSVQAKILERGQVRAQQSASL
ncbi:MAG: hypothetical protein C4516_02740 [Oxalobacter sp.]|nr:MAG: hypothetical protein C4516_02740 [Oxalobacter sp.]